MNDALPSDIQRTRGWLLLVFASVVTIYGLVSANPAYVMFGFSALGAEPLARLVPTEARK